MTMRASICRGTDVRINMLPDPLVLDRDERVIRVTATRSVQP